MKDRLAVTVATDLNHTYECNSNIIGREGEGNVSQLKITIPEALCNYSVFIDFEKPSGETIRTPSLPIENCVATYDVPQYVLSESGEIKVQLVFQKADGTIWKSSIKTYFNQKSINAVDDIPDEFKEDFVTEAQKLIDKLSGEVSEIAFMLANDQEFVDAVISRMEIPTYVTTIKGTVLKFFVGTQAEYNALSADEKANLFAIITDDPTREAVVAMTEDFSLLKIAVDNNTRAINDLKGMLPVQTSGLGLRKLTESGYYSFNLYLRNYDYKFSMGIVYWEDETTAMMLPTSNLIVTGQGDVHFQVVINTDGSFGVRKWSDDTPISLMGSAEYDLFVVKVG